MSETDAAGAAVWRIERIDLRRPASERYPRTPVLVAVLERDEALALARRRAADEVERLDAHTVSERVFPGWASILVCGPLVRGLAPGLVAYELTPEAR